MSSQHLSDNMTTPENTFHQALLDKDYGKKASQRGILPETRVQLFVWLESAAIVIGTATAHRGAKRSGSFPPRRLFNHELFQNGSSDLTVIRGLHIML